MQPNNKLENDLLKLIKSNNKIAEQICCLTNSLSSSNDTAQIIEAIEELNKKKDFEPLVLCDISNGEPVIVTYEYDDTGLLTFSQQNIDGTPFLGIVGKCLNKNYGITSKEWFCLTATQTNITREDIVDLHTATSIISLWRNELGTIIPTPTTGTFTVGVCTIPTACTPTISEAYGDDLATLLKSTSFVITKPSCCTIRITTSAGVFTLRQVETYYSTTEFSCPITISNVEVVSGNCTLDKVHIIGNNKGI